ncbi:hypothetical protein G5A69_11315 [Ralstonia mannitolilytica]|nr:hypothetical protein G5A69_11315 [Ralstonia mannitolilytica]
MTATQSSVAVSFCAPQKETRYPPSLDLLWMSPGKPRGDRVFPALARFLIFSSAIRVRLREITRFVHWGNPVKRRGYGKKRCCDAYCIRKKRGYNARVSN